MSIAIRNYFQIVNNYKSYFKMMEENVNLYFVFFVIKLYNFFYGNHKQIKYLIFDKCLLAHG